MSEKKYIDKDTAISLLPDKESIHTFYDMPFGLLGADWSRDDIVEKIRSSDRIELAGPGARSTRHGLAVYDSNTKWQSEILFIETDKNKLDELYPLRENTAGGKKWE